MKDYCGQMIRQECAALNNAILFNERAGSALAVRVISERLAGFVKNYLEDAEEEGGAA